ncbi:MAG TPA: hypothetical protein PK747_02100, partial [Acidobacteriota bacterium]|nr:hypothetical protein [Acidobacteriota bacterium]HQQ46185.1 hypothetical protein [Acidobacteriota bacterium]
DVKSSLGTIFFALRAGRLTPELKAEGSIWKMIPQFFTFQSSFFNFQCRRNLPGLWLVPRLKAED